MTNGSNPKALEGLKDTFLSGTLGQFMGKMYDKIKANPDQSDAADALIKLNVRTRVALRNDGYHKNISWVSKGITKNIMV